MKEEKIIDINGSKYSASTGMPISKTDSTKKINRTPVINERIKSVQSLTKKSQTIYNRTAGKAVQSIGSPLRKIGRSMDIARSKSISHFTPKTVTDSKKNVTNTAQHRRQMDLGPTKHPLVSKIKSQSQSGAIEVLSSKITKENVIAEALKNAPSKSEKLVKKRRFKFFNIITVSFILLVAIVYITYLSMPMISVKIASAQAGIGATYPEYRPDGYSLDGPVTYSDGEVVMNFHANTGNTEFSIRQSKSSWDSTAVREKINKDLNGEFITTEEKGLTIYTYGGNATWVNGGILYSITGDAPLKSDQIRRIASSL